MSCSTADRPARRITWPRTGPWRPSPRRWPWAPVIFQQLAETCAVLCRADSAGISILESDGGREVIRWSPTSPGRSAPAPAVGWRGTAARAGPRSTATPSCRAASSGTPHPRLAADPPLVETLLVPFHSDGKPVGTIWVIAHTEQRRFDAEDARLLESLCRFAAAANLTIGALDAAEAGRAELERRVAECTRQLSDANEALREAASGGSRRRHAGRMAMWQRTPPPTSWRRPTR